MPETTEKQIIVSWSTGKDSAWMLHRLRLAPMGKLIGLMSTTVGDQDLQRVAMHGIRMPALQAQAAAAGLPVIDVRLPDPCSNADYEKAMNAFVTRAKADGVTHIAFGDLFLEDVRRYREDRMAGTGIEPLFPLWGADTRALSREMVDSGLKARIVSVDLTQLGAEFAGRDFDHDFLDALPASCDPCGEKGEFHSFAYAGPMFAAELPLVMGETRRGERFIHIEPLVAREEMSWPTG